ncbi:MAG: type IX secretion system protein PorQ, partial [Paludibacteraceae bacterium]|nr:type IX secretion system protein PorQ [Paludibacteraceae bacterium]
RQKIGFFLLLSVLCLPAAAQVSSAGRSVFSFMSLPASSRLNALGGSNVSLSDGDISMGMCNPALLHENSHMVLQLNYSYYLPGTMFGSALYGHNFGRSKIENYESDGEPDKPNYFAVGLHYLDYGRMQYADKEGNLSGGSFGARDILIDVMYARQLHPCWKIGVTLKPVYSIYESYSSFAIGVDVGAHYRTPDSTFQMGLVLQNIGWQLKGFYSDEGGSNHEMLPLNLQLGLSYRVKHAPLRFHLQIHNMQTWYLNYEWTSLDKSPTTGDIIPHDIPWYDMMFRHTIWAIEVVPKSEKFYIALSYNHRRRAELNLTDQRSLAGFALGAGVKIKQARVGFAVSQLTKANFSYQLGLTLDINSLLK